MTKSEEKKQRFREWRKSPKQKAKSAAYAKKYWQRPDVKARLRVRLSTPQGRLYARNAKFLYLYGISLKDRETMYQKQGGKCAICVEQLDPTSRHMHVDHDHATGKVRELLCNKCNRLLGSAREDAGILMSAIMYLAKHTEILTLDVSA